MAEPTEHEPLDESSELADLQKQMDEQAAVEAAKNAPSPTEETAAKKKKDRLGFLKKIRLRRRKEAHPENDASEEQSKKVPRIPLSNVFGEMMKALLSEDKATRRMAWVFFAGLLGIGFVGSIFYERYIRYQDIKKYQSDELERTQKNIGEFLAKQAEHAKAKHTTLALGKFTIDMKEVQGAKPNRGVMNAVEIDMVVLCDSKETRYFIEEHLPQAQDQVMSALGGLEREDILTREGKKRLKKKVLDRINAWLPRGKIDDLFINDLLAS